MPYIVTESCIKCKYTDCVEVCPVDCFYEGPNMLAINPDECIDCALCEPECPVDAIKPEDDVTDEQKVFIELNAKLAERWPNITSAKEAPTDAKEWEDKPNKRVYLIKEAQNKEEQQLISNMLDIKVEVEQKSSPQRDDRVKQDTKNT